MESKPAKNTVTTGGNTVEDVLPKFQQRSSIFIKLAIAFIIGAGIPLAMAISISYEESVRATTEEIKKDLQEIATGRDAVLVEHINGILRLASMIADSKDVADSFALVSAADAESPATNAAEKLIRDWQASIWGEIHDILITDTDGTVLLRSDHSNRMSADDAALSVPQLVGSIGSSDLFNGVLAENRGVCLFGYGDDEYCAPLVIQPIRDSRGAVLGAVVIELKIEHLNELLSQDSSLGVTGRVKLASRDGKILTEDESGKREGITSAGLRLAVDSGELVVGDYQDANGERIYGAYFPSNLYPWVLCVEIGSAEVSHPIEQHRSNLLVLAGIVFTMLLGFSVLISKRFGTPLRVTAEMVERVAQGDLETPIVVTNSDEIGLVQASAESMRIRLRDQIRDLDMRIDESLREQRFLQVALDEHLLISSTDLSGKITSANKRFCEVSGYTEEELVGQDHRIVNSGFHSKSFFSELYSTLTRGDIWRGELCNRSKSGELYWVDTTIVPSVDDQGKVIRYTAVRNDITALRVAQDRFATAVRGSRDGLWDWNLLTDEVFYAPQFNQMLGLEKDTLHNSPGDWINLILSDDLGLFQAKLESHIRGREEIFECEIRMIHTDGNPRWMLCRGAAIREADGRAIRLAGSMAEITEMKEAQSALKRAAEHDRLTDLPNRSLLHKHVQRAILRQLKDEANLFAVLFFDFDRFKTINDSLGHKVGDQLLISIAERFHEVLRPYDIAARFGGDEFVVLLNNLETIEDGEEIAGRLLHAFSKAHPIGGHSVKSTASIGLVMGEKSYQNADEMIRDADAAMYQAKAQGRGRVVVFDTEMHSQALDRLILEEDLEDSIHRQELRLFYQPIIDLDNGALVGFEALVRWQHPKRGLVPPDQFIGIAEDSGFIIDLGEWVLRAACVQITYWNESIRTDQPMFMNVNVSKRQLTHPDFIGTIKRIIDETQIDPRLLKIEITESTIVDNRTDIIPTLERIRELGCRLAMDDFGTGHSSLSGLHKFPIDILKIDRSFIASMEESHDLAAVVHSIVTLAQHLGMEIVAEGIETIEQVAILQSHGVQFGQGYHFSKPMPPADAERFILALESDHADAA